MMRTEEAVKNFDVRLKGRKIRSLWCSLCAEKVFDNKGKIEGYDVVTHNISKRKEYEKEIIESLDELIKKLEQQASAGGGGGSGSGKGNQPQSGAEDSRVKGSTAPGEVDDKNLGQKDGWGKLPPKDQAKAKQILGTLFPPHYRRAIEAYNKKAAQRKSPTP